MKPATTPSPAARPGVLAPERHVVYAAQDAAVCRVGEQDLLLLQIAERPRWLGRAVPYASNGIPGRRIGDGAGDDRHTRRAHHQGWRVRCAGSMRRAVIQFSWQRRAGHGDDELPDVALVAWSQKNFNRDGATVTA